MITTIAAVLLLVTQPVEANPMTGVATVQEIGLLEDDESHPILQVDILDIFAEMEGGGGVLVMVIASPLNADERSQRRLLAKLENYLTYINSTDFESRYGSPALETVTVRVVIDPDSHPIIFDLLERSRPWVADNHASLVIERSQ